MGKFLAVGGWIAGDSGSSLNDQGIDFREPKSLPSPLLAGFNHHLCSRLISSKSPERKH